MIFTAAADILSGMRDASMSITDCFDANGHMDTQRYLEMIMADEGDDIDEMMIEDLLLHDDDTQHPPVKKKRKKRIILARRTAEGDLEEIPPKESLWWHMYIDCPQYDDPRFLRKFRRRFRLPYTQFTSFVQEAKNNNWFPRWMGKDAAGKESSPLELLILGAFRYLGRGFTFDDLEECTAISEEVHRVFFHKFIEIGSTVLYDKYVKAPQNEEELEDHMKEFNLAGMPGAFASMDATHIIHELCCWKSRRAHIGHKSKHATRTYNLMANHRRRILGSTRGNPGSFNDKTLILFDTFVQEIKSGKFDDYTFELLERRGDEIVAVKYKGVWIVVDNGYHKWSITVPPIANSETRTEIRWSEWVESMRKDVECTFGILKGRWRILKTGVRLHSIESVDRIWLTCCALHNMLLEVDGLDAPWDGINVPTSEWEHDLGELDEDDVPLALTRILWPAEIRAYDTSRVGEHQEQEESDDLLSDDDQDHSESEDDNDNEVRHVRNLSLDYFRSKLVEHFDIKFWQHQIVWPRRRGVLPHENLSL